MGWDYTHRPEGESIREFLDRELGGQLVDLAVVGFREAYAALRTGDGRTVGAVILLDYRPRDYFNVGYKLMDEAMGPFYYRCPERILRQLSPPTTEEAATWRRRCAEASARRRAGQVALRHGARVRLPEPMRFSDGVARQEFTVTRRGRRVRFLAEDGTLCRISAPHQYAWEVVTDRRDAS